MAHFDAAAAMREVGERGEQLASGDRLIPVATAVMAVLAALATLFAHHSSIASLAHKNQAILFQSQATDQYNFYESKRIRAQLDQALLDSGSVTPGNAAAMRARTQRQNRESVPILEKAQSLEAQSTHAFEDSERVMSAYQSFQVAATIFEVCVILVSITALMRTRALLWVGVAGTIAGLAFLIAGFVQ